MKVRLWMKDRYANGQWNMDRYANGRRTKCIGGYGMGMLRIWSGFVTLLQRLRPRYALDHTESTAHPIAPTIVISPGSPPILFLFLRI